MFPSIRWRIALPYTVLILLVMLGLTLYLTDFVRDIYLDRLRSELSAQARLIGDALTPSLLEDDLPILDEEAQRYADLLEVRVTIIAPDGTVLGESDEDRTQMDNHLLRPEVQQALEEGEGSSIRYSRTVGYEMMYLAIPLFVDGEVVGISRVALPLRQVNAGVSRLRQIIALASLAASGLAVLLALLVAQRTVQPIRQLTGVAERLATGDLDARLLLTKRDEVGQLARTFNDMADQLRQQMAILGEERSRLAAVLEHMADGVLITDSEGWVRLINPAAADLLDTTVEDALNAYIAPVVRHHRLIELWRNCLESGKQQIEIVEVDRQGLFLQAIATPFQETDALSYLIILQDLTLIRRLETVRRDFISNISHELRTPLAGLRALVDTLRDGALEDPPAARRFLDRIETEVDALTQTVQELLELTRIESGQAPLHLQPTPVGELVVPSVERLSPQAERAGIEMRIELADDLPDVMADLERARQVMTNLVHNAIKFTPPGGQITVSAQAEEKDVVISVRDTGIGIPADLLSRIFERFYKADRARSGGGTGLGLAIAKHIVQAHGGRIWAESIEGESSTFFFSLSSVSNSKARS